MSTEEVVDQPIEKNKVIETPETGNPEPVPAEPDESGVEWDDVPDPADDPAENPPAPEPKPSDGEPSDPPAAPKFDEENPSENPENPDSGDDDDPYSFLDELDKPENPPENPPVNGTGKPDAPPTQPAPSAEVSSLDELNLDELIEGLPDGDLKNFAKDYHEETRMAAEMARQILKKLGYDQLRSDVKKYSGAAEQFGRNQQELQAKAAQEAFEQAVMKVHPDIKKIIAGEEKRTFAAWLKSQPRFIQQRFRDTCDPEEASDIISRYKNSRDGQRTAQHKRTSKFSGVRSTVSAPHARPGDEVGWNDIKDEDVPEY